MGQAAGTATRAPSARPGTREDIATKPALAVHCDSLVAPLDAVPVFSGQVVQTPTVVARMCALNVSRGHGEQRTLLSVSANVPAGHASHDVASYASLYVPSGQGSQ